MTLESQVGELLGRHGLTLATAESCTGGLIAHRLTNIPGSSSYFVGGVVAYAYEAKEALLGVRRETLMQYGAVSEQVALEMARGVRQRLGADLGLSVTGIAGPGGGTPEKPVGLTYIALVGPQGERCERHTWPGDRWENKTLSAEAALRLLLTYLQDRRTP